MSSINTICALSVNFKIPWLLFLLIPAYGLMLWPYFRLSKQHRRTTSRVVSLVLHSVIILLCVLMLCGMSFEHYSVSIKNDVILLVDVSDSNGESQGEMNSFIRGVIDEGKGDYRFGIITFANGQVYSAELNKNGEQAYKDYINTANKPEGNATDIASALMFARTKLADRSSGRIIILSDGLQTDGNALAAVKTLADEGTRVDTVYFSPKEYKSEVQINSVEVPQNLSFGDTAQIMVTLQSASACTATITLYDNDKVFGTQDVTLSGGEEVFSFQYAIVPPKFHAFHAKVVVTDAESDTLTQNNEYYTYLNIEASNKILLVDGSGDETAQLEEILNGDYEIEKINVNQLPTTLEELCGYNEVVFANVANADLPAGFDDILIEYVEIFGGGFYTIGGDKAYQQADMEGTKYQELLPIEANTEAKSLGLLLVIDVSTSMDLTASGSTAKRIDLAINGACASVEALKPEDYVGVITFNKEPTVLIPMQSVATASSRQSIITQIRSGIKITQQGTSFSNALSTARNVFASFNATELEHVIFLTDGEPAQDTGNYMNEVDRLYATNVTLSTIAFGPEQDQFVQIAKDMAERGGGRFYNVARGGELAGVMEEETTIAASQYENAVRTPIKINSFTSASVAGISALPDLSGFYGTRLKNDAIMVLACRDNPIYAEWSCGAGKVGSFMSDLNGTWSEKFLSDESGRRFVLNSIGGRMRQGAIQAYSEIRAEIINNNFTAELHVYTDAKAGESITAQLTSPDGKTSTITLAKQTGSLYAGTFNTPVSGIYKIEITKNGSSGIKEVFYTAASYSKEYSVFADDTECFHFLENISVNGNGAMLFSTENLFGKNNEVVRSTFNPQLTFLIISIVLFLADIVVRKFKIKWPHEIIRERRNKQQEDAA